VEGKVGECSGAFLGGGVGWLEDKGGLDGEKEAGGVEELSILLVSLGEEGKEERKGRTGCAEKKMSF
jgi:hypothetical protein